MSQSHKKPNTQDSISASSAGFYAGIDRLWLSLASVKLTLVILTALLLLSIPGTLILQLNISNVDPGSQYEYDFWSLGQRLQLFTAYHSYWYVGLMVLLSMNLIACSVERWPQMWRLANAKPVAWAPQTFEQVSKEFIVGWKSQLKPDEALESYQQLLNEKWTTPHVVEKSENGFQLFFQKGRWSRVANYLVHTSLLVIFAGGIISALYGFDGAASIPEGQAIDTFLLFSEGRASGLERPDPKLYPDGSLPLVNERLLGFRLFVPDFNVEFYKEFKNRPQDFVSQLQVMRRDPLTKDYRVLKEGEIRVNSPMSFENFTFYQSSYGRMGRFNVSYRVVDLRDGKKKNQLYASSDIDEVRTFDSLGIGLVPIEVRENVENYGSAIRLLPLKDGKASDEPFWVFANYPNAKTNKDERYQVVLDRVQEQLFTGLQIGYDPGAPLYWLGCFGMLLGTFYALLVTHRKFHLRFDRGHVVLAGSIHRLPSGFENQIKKWAEDFQKNEKRRSLSL